MASIDMTSIKLVYDGNDYLCHYCTRVLSSRITRSDDYGRIARSDDYNCGNCDVRYYCKYLSTDVIEMLFHRGELTLSIDVLAGSCMLFSNWPHEVICSFNYIPADITPENVADKIDKWLLLA